MSEFKYQEPFPLSADTTEYRLLTKDYVKVVECDGRKILKVDPKGLELLSKEAFGDVSFYLRAAHLQKLANILEDPEATDNDKFVAYTMLINQTVAAEGELPTCQDTGTAIVIGKKGEDVYTGANDAEALSKGVYETYKERNLRYSQVVPFTMIEEKNSGTNLPAQIDIYATQGNEYNHQRWRISQQDFPVSADQSAADRRESDELYQNPYHGFGNGCMSSLPPGNCNRWYICRG